MLQYVTTVTTYDIIGHMTILMSIDDFRYVLIEVISEIVYAELNIVIIL